MYDLLNFRLDSAVKFQIANLIRTCRKKLEIRIANVNKQAGYDDCGVFATAYCTALASGQDPARFVYDQSVMRKHLK